MVLPVRIRLFGSPEVEKDGRAISIPRRKTLALLAYLAVTGQAHSREALAAFFWPEYDQSHALANLRRDLSRLKELFSEDMLAVDRMQAGINSQIEIDLDVAAFQARVKQAGKHNHTGESPCDECYTNLKAAVEIYRGDFMAGFNLPDSPGFDEWQFFTRDGLRRSLAAALQHLINWHASRDEFEFAVRWARQWLALDRLHEPAHRGLMQLYAWSGQRAAALRQYQECQRILQEELRIEPEEETRSLYEAIRSRTLVTPEWIADGRSAPTIQTPHPNSPASGGKRFSQAIRFCTAPDGVRLAYASVGQGPVLVKAANWLSHLEHDWNSPVWRHWLTGLAENNTLVRYDERGCGLSDWNVDQFTLDAWVLDLEAVVNAMELKRFPLLGISQGASIAVEYAARHPEKVSRLILYGGYLRGRLQRNLTPEQLEELDVMLQLIKIGWGKEHPAFRQVFSMLFLPEGTAEQLHAFNELQRISTTPEIAARIVGGFQSIDVRERARQITQPTLVLHARDDLRIPFEEGRLMAAAIPHARLVTLESRNHILLEGEPAWDRFLAEVNGFLRDADAG